MQIKNSVYVCGSVPLIGILFALFFYNSAAILALESSDPHWRNFQHALAQPAMIGANANHELADSTYRPLPLPDPESLDPARFELGSSLFHEGRLSSGNSIACVTCHAGALSGTDRRQVSLGVGGAPGHMNALSVFNATFNFRQFWDGRAVTLEDQALLPVETAFEMANRLDDVERFLQGSAYRQRFEAVYPDGVTVLNMANAIAHFERHAFIRLDTPFQRFLNGDESALDEQSRRGWQTFDEIGCSSCHNGINIGGNSYQQLGTLVPFYGTGQEADEHDRGVMERSGRESDRYLFRVPSLHGVATTPPYFHDGSVANLEEAVSLMARHQLGRQLPDTAIEDIAAFLRSLGGYFTSGRKATTALTNADLPVVPGTGDIPAHQQAYLDTIAALESALPRLVQEADNIIDGQVSHFDFLQFQHRELIRFARALEYPPGSLAQQDRRELQKVARQLLAEIMNMEWLIADFLRAQATINVLTALATTATDSVLIDNIPQRLAEQQAVRARTRLELEMISLAEMTMALSRLTGSESDE